MQRIRGTSARGGALLFLGLATSGLFGCGLAGRATPPLDRSGDRRIRQEVESRIAGESVLDPATLREDVDAGIVLLHGSVAGIGAWQCALTTSGLVPGVRSVVDYLVIERGPRNVACAAPRPDSMIATGR